MTILLIAAGSHVHGFDDYTSSFDTNDDNCCPSSDCCAQPSCCSQGFVSADFLYWTAYQGGLEVCGPSETIDIINPGGGVTSFFNGKTKDPHFDWSPGFRIAAGYPIKSSCWDVAVYWTHFCTKVHRNFGDDHRFRWRLNFDVVDVVIGREFNLGSCFTVRPFSGVRGAFIDQKAKGFELDALLFTTAGEKRRSRFAAVGLLAGLETVWNIGCGWGVYANAAISGLWGRYRVKCEEFSTFPFGAEFCNFREHLEACQLVIDSGFGISWTKCFCNNKQFVLKIGFEQHRYFDHNRIGDYGDLCLGGGLVSAGFKF